MAFDDFNKKDPFTSWKGNDFNKGGFDSYKAPDWRSDGDPFRHQDWKDGGSWRHGGGNWNNQKFEKKRLF